MTRLVFVRRFLTDYARNPVNLVLLAVVPVLFVVVVAGTIADFAKLLGGTGPAVQTVAAAWAAAFLAGIAMYFQTATPRETDRRVVIAGLPAPASCLPGSSPASPWPHSPGNRPGRTRRTHGH